MNVSEYYFSGGVIPTMFDHIRAILNQNPQVKYVILILGGNDCESNQFYLEDIKHNYDTLIDMIKLTVPDCNVVISSVPQRRWRCSQRTHIRIAKLNLYNSQKENPEYGVFYVDAAPRFGHQFRDRVHFNHLGLEHWSEAITNKLVSISNFQEGETTTRL